jgi:hypothetical protein
MGSIVSLLRGEQPIFKPGPASQFSSCIKEHHFQRKSYSMKNNFYMLAAPAAIATSLLLFGCNSEKITARNDPGVSSSEQVSAGYDTLGRKWGTDMVTRSNSMLLQVTGTITDIDYTTREFTLTDPQGRNECFVAADGVQRFNEAKVGDKVTLEYYLGYNAEVRKPTAEEAQNPLVVQEGLSRTGRDAAPAGRATRRTRAVVTIEAMDRAAQTITVKGPRGKYFVAGVEDPSNFDKVQVGDTIVLTFNEAAAISLKPAEK